VCVETEGKDAGEDGLMLFVSGLSLGDPTSDPLATDLLVDLITGNLGGSRPFPASFCLVLFRAALRCPRRRRN
jgi:hypothetical protein